MCQVPPIGSQEAPSSSQGGNASISTSPIPFGPAHNGASAGISATRDVSHSSLHFLSILCHKTFHSFAANNLTSSHAKKSKSVGQFVRYNQFCDVMFTRFLAEIRYMFGSLSKPHLWMELQTKSGIHVELSALQNGYLEFSDFWVFDPKIFQKHYNLKMSIKSICFLKIYKQWNKCYTPS